MTIGPLSFVCDECGGTGTVGGEQHGGRAAGHEYDPVTDGPIPPIRHHPVVKAMGVCPLCLGAKTVVNLGGIGEPTGKLVEAPCPACAA